MQKTQETQVRFLGQEDPLKYEMATHFHNFDWEIPWIEEPGGFNVWGPKELDTIEQLSTHKCNSWHTLADSGEITGNIDNIRPLVVCTRVGKTDAEQVSEHTDKGFYSWRAGRRLKGDCAKGLEGRSPLNSSRIFRHLEQG